MKNFLRSLSKNFPLYFPKCFSRNFLRRFTRHFPKIFPPRIYRLRSPRRGYIAILLVAFIPVILLGTRWVLDTVTLQKIKINMMPVEGETQKKCAAQAALAVAQNWNPGLPLSRQKNTALKIADAVYNDNTPVVTNDSNILAKAIPGLQLEVVDSVIHGKGFDPVKITSKSAVSGSSSPIEYETCKKYSVKNTATAPADFNAPFFSWRIVDVATSSENDLEKFDELDSSTDPSKKYVIFHEDRYQSPYAQIAKNSPTREQFSSASSQLVSCANSSSAGADESGYKNIAENLSVPCTCASLSENGTYTKRKTEGDSRVQVLVENDKIKVVTDNDVGYALPAQCNVDIVLACPTNAAATNKDNRDKNSDTAGAPCTNENEIASCPIYQIGQALRGFVKQFYHTRGVTMGLVPYSGKVSLSPEIAEKYTINYAKCNDKHSFYEGYYLGIDPTLKAEDKVEAFLRGAVLYDSCGQKGYDLDDPYKNMTTSDGSSAEKKAPYDWNTALTACPIRCRGPVTIPPYQGNVICVGDIFSTAEPDQTKANTLFFRQNSNPCYGGNANLLSMKCEQTSPTHLPNPYYIIEPTADLQKIYEMCGALYPFYDDKNVSNFIFIPVTWANNLWQSWTRDPGCPASGDNLSIPSKVDNADAGTSGSGNQTAADSAAKRKKALILVINKPDWFEPNELTYLGFDNDFSELPMIESDRIDFSENYAAAANKKFADGTPYDGTIQGAKKILKAEIDSGVAYNTDTKHYESDEGTVTLKFPRKYLVKVVVEPIVYSGIKWKGRGKIFTDGDYSYRGVMGWDGTKFLVHGRGEETFNVMTSEDGEHWEKSTVQGHSFGWTYPVFGGGRWISQDYYHTCVCENGNWQWHNNDNTAENGKNSPFQGGAVAYGNGTFMGIDIGWRGYGEIHVSSTGDFWTKNTSDYYNSDALYRLSSYSDNHYSLAYLDGKWYSIMRNGKIATSTDNGKSWSIFSEGPSEISGGTKDWYGIIEAFGCFWATTTSDDGLVIVSSDKGKTWEDAGIRLNSFGGSSYRGLGTNGDVIIFKSDDGYLVTGRFNPDKIVRFSNITAGSLTDTKEYVLTERKEFFIEADQISGSDGNYTINMNLENIRLISAEITNRPYKKIDAECKLEGTKIKTNAKKPMTVKVSPTRSGSVTFSNVNNSEIGDKSGTHALSASQTFTFPAGNFEKNGELAKISYNLQNATITNCYLKNQQIRIKLSELIDADSFMTKGVDDNLIAVSTSALTSYPGRNMNPNTTIELYTPIKQGHMYFRVYRWVDTGHSASASLEISCNSLIFATIDKADKGRNSFTPSNDAEIACLNGSNGYWEATHYSIDFDFDGSGNSHIKMVTGDASNGGDNFLHTLFVTNKEQVNLGSASDKNSIYLADGNINFRGAGELTVVVEPINITGAIRYASPENAEVTETFTEERVITIDPDNYKYEDDGNGGYIIDLTTDKVTLSDLKFKDEVGPVSCEWEEIRTPDESRVADFRENKNNIYTYKVCGKEVATANDYIAAGRDTSGAIGSMEIRWNATKLCWEFYPASSGCSHSDHFWPKSSFGDMYMLTDATEISSATQPYYYLWIDPTASGIPSHISEYFGTNLYRSFWNFEDCKRKALGNTKQFGYSFETYNTVLPLVYAGFTLPINAILHHAYYDGDAHEEAWYVDESGNTTYDASEAAKNAALKALFIIKKEWSDNLRIYLIMFRKQEKYKHKITDSNTNYSYKYLNDCSDIYAKYDVTTEGDLKAKLNEIASEIKEWAGYEEAKNGTTH